MSLFLSCGEASGDYYAAGLLKGLRHRGLNLPAWGMVGDLTRAAGALEVWNASALGLVGVTEVLPSLPRLWRLKEQMAETVVARQPSCIVLVDSPDFHLPLVRAIRSKGYSGSIVYVAPPTVWAWRRRRSVTLREGDVHCLPLFGFEHRLLEELGVSSSWEAHPLLEGFRNYVPPEELQERFGGRKPVALLPGSRPSEIANLLGELEKAADGLRQRGLAPVFSVASGLPASLRQQMKKRLAPYDIYEGPARDIMAVAELVIGASGTASVEALCLEKFMIVLYKMASLSYLVARAFVRVPYAAMPNILAGEEIYPEFLQDQARAENVLAAVDRFLEKRGGDGFRSGIVRARSEMGEGSAYNIWARIVQERMES